LDSTVLSIDILHALRYSMLAISLASTLLLIRSYDDNRSRYLQPFTTLITSLFSFTLYYMDMT